MIQQHLILPEYASILDLDSASRETFSELGLIKVQSQINEFVKRELYELPQKGVFQYFQSLTGNDISNTFNLKKGNEIRREHHNLCGLLQVLGFDETKDEYHQMVDVVRKNMSDYFFEIPLNK